MMLFKSTFNVKEEEEEKILEMQVNSQERNLSH